MNGEFDFSEFSKMVRQLEQASNPNNIDRFMREFLTELAYRALAKTIKKTPHATPFLKLNWKVGDIRITANGYEVDMYNNTEYASYVEFGHRTRNGGWVEGRFMATLSLKEVEREMPKYFEKKMKDYLGGIV